MCSIHLSRDYLVHSPPSNPWQQLIFCYLYSSAFSRMSYSWNPWVCSLLKNWSIINRPYYSSDKWQYVLVLSCFSRVWLCAAPWTAACQAPLSMRFPRQEHWSGFPFPPPGDLPDPAIKPGSSALAGRFFTTESPGKPRCIIQGFTSFKPILHLQLLNLKYWLYKQVF